MDVRYVNPFIASVTHVFKTMVDVEVQVLKPTVKDGHRDAGDVSGVIGLSGDVSGACILCFPAEVACKVASAFAGQKMTLDDPDFSDAIGELANMVAGAAKARFDGVTVSISLPSVVIGKRHEVAITGLPSDLPRLIIPCQTELGNFHVEVAMIICQTAAPDQHEMLSNAGAT